MEDLVRELITSVAAEDADPDPALEITFSQFVTFLTTETGWQDGMPLDSRQASTQRRHVDIL